MKKPSTTKTNQPLQSSSTTNGISSQKWQFGQKKKKNPKNNEERKRIKKEEKENQRKEKILAFNDPNNEYLNTINKRIRAINKKIKQYDLLEKKIENGEKLQNEQISAVKSKEKMEKTVSEFDKMLFLFKEIAFQENSVKIRLENEEKKKEEKKKKLEIQKQNKIENEIKKIKSESDKKVELLKEKLKQTEKDFSDFKHKQKETEQMIMLNTLKLIHIFHFLDFLNDNELEKLAQELSEKSNSKEIISVNHLESVRVFVYRLSGASNPHDLLKTPKDVYYETLQLTQEYLTKSDKIVETLDQKISYAQIFDLVCAIFASDIYQNGRLSGRAVVFPPANSNVDDISCNNHRFVAENVIETLNNNSEMRLEHRIPVQITEDKMCLSVQKNDDSQHQSPSVQEQEQQIPQITTKPDTFSPSQSSVGLPNQNTISSNQTTPKHDSFWDSDSNQNTEKPEDIFSPQKPSNSINCWNNNKLTNVVWTNQSLSSEKNFILNENKDSDLNQNNESHFEDKKRTNWSYSTNQFKQNSNLNRRHYNNKNWSRNVSKGGKHSDFNRNQDVQPNKSNFRGTNRQKYRGFEGKRARGVV